MIWVHIVWTLLLAVTFTAIVVWAWSGKQKKRFSDAARIPLDDEPGHRRSSTD